MRRIIVLLAVIAGLVPTLAARAAEPSDEAQSGAAVVDACAQTAGQAPEVGPRACRSAQSVIWGTGQACRRAGAPDDVCIRTDGRDLSEAAMAAYEASWTHRAHALQRDLDAGVPLLRALVPHTHNSFNSTAYMATLSGSDPNQAVSMTDQLRLDMQALEIDLHWFPSPTADPGDGGKAPIMCHGRTEQPEPLPVPVHVGCTAERHLGDGLAEVRQWLIERDAAGDPRLLMLYLENQLDNDPTAHAAAARTIEAELGERLITTPAGQPCAPLPLTESKQSLMKRNNMAGDESRVLIVGNCDTAVAGPWGSVVHERGPQWEESGSGMGDDFDCDAERSATDFRTHWIRHWEDSTWLSTMVGSAGEVTREETRAMVRCGVHMPGFDQLRASDRRLEDLIWSWAPDEPSTAGACAAQGADGRFRATNCRAHLRYACVDAAGAWLVTASRGRSVSAEKACARAFPGSRPGVPANGWENALLRAAAGPGASVWLAYRQVDGVWTVQR